MPWKHIPLGARFHMGQFSVTIPTSTGSVLSDIQHNRTALTHATAASGGPTRPIWATACPPAAGISCKVAWANSASGRSQLRMHPPLHRRVHNPSNPASGTGDHHNLSRQIRLCYRSLRFMIFCTSCSGCFDVLLDYRGLFDIHQCQEPVVL